MTGDSPASCTLHGHAPALEADPSATADSIAGFVFHPQRPRALLVGGDAGIATLIRLAGLWPAHGKPLVLLGSEAPFGFRTRPSTILVPGMPEGTIACVPALEERGVPSRLATHADSPGCYDGDVTSLAATWLASLDEATLGEVEMFACGPAEMLRAAAELARRLGVPCQVSAEA